MSISTQQQLSIRVYYEDTDAGGIVFYANYLKFFERARTEWLRALNIHQSTLLNESIAFVVNKVNMHNVFPAKLDDMLMVTSSISKIKGASVTFSQKIMNQHNQLVCTADVLIVCVSLANEIPKPQPFPNVILGALKSVS